MENSARNTSGFQQQIKMLTGNMFKAVNNNGDNDENELHYNFASTKTPSIASF